MAATAARDPDQPSLTEQYGIDYVIALIGERVVEPDKVDAAPGCADQAATEVAGPGAELVSEGAGAVAGPTSQLVGRLSTEAAGRTADDSRVVAAVDGWSRCMRGRGHAFDDPQAPVAQFLEGVDMTGGPDGIAAPAPAEVATARDDVACKVEVELEAIWLAVETAYQDAIVERDADALEAYVAWRDGQVERARELVDRP
jgi:hypothetical protein